MKSSVELDYPRLKQNLESVMCAANVFSNFVG